MDGQTGRQIADNGDIIISGVRVGSKQLQQELKDFSVARILGIGRKEQTDMAALLFVDIMSHSGNLLDSWKNVTMVTCAKTELV